MRGQAALAHGFVHDDGAGDRDVERGDRAGHGDAQEVVAGLFDQIVQAGAFASEDEDAVGAEVEIHIVWSPAFVEAEDPDVGLLHLLERADEVGDAGDSDVFGGTGGGLGDGRGDWGGAAFGQDDSVDSRAIGGAQERAEVVRVLDAVEGEEEFVRGVNLCAVCGCILRNGFRRGFRHGFRLGFGGGLGREQVFDGEEGALADQGDGPLVGVGACQAGELVSGFEGEADVGVAAELGEALQAGVAALAGEQDAVQPARAGADGLLDRVQAVKNFHGNSLLPKQASPRRTGWPYNRLSGYFSAFSACGRPHRKESRSMRFLSRGEKSGADRDFSLQGAVSPCMGSAASAISMERAEQSQRENAAIARGLKNQDTELLDHLIELYQHRLLRYLLFLTGKREVAEDLFQETWMRVLLRGGQYNGKARFDTWLFTIARNLVIDLSRKRTMSSLDEMSEPTDEGRAFEIAAEGPSPLEQFAGGEDRAEVAAVLLKLEPNYREVLTLRFHEEMSLEEIASVTRAPLSTVKSRLYRGLAALKPGIEHLRSMCAMEATG